LVHGSRHIYSSENFHKYKRARLFEWSIADGKNLQTKQTDLAENRRINSATVLMVFKFQASISRCFAEVWQKGDCNVTPTWTTCNTASNWRHVLRSVNWPPPRRSCETLTMQRASSSVIWRHDPLAWRISAVSRWQLSNSERSSQPGFPACRSAISAA